MANNEVGNMNLQGMDEDKLAELGYKQELRRDWGLLHNFGTYQSIYKDIIFLLLIYPF